MAASRQQVAVPKRGEIYYVRFDPAEGAEIQKTRPALILPNNLGNRISPVTIVAAISSNVPTRPHPVRVLVSAKESGLPLDSAVVLNQIRTVDKIRLGRRLGSLSKATMAKVDQALQISLGLIPPE